MKKIMLMMVMAVLVTGCRTKEKMTEKTHVSEDQTVEATKQAKTEKHREWEMLENVVITFGKKGIEPEGEPSGMETEMGARKNTFGNGTGTKTKGEPSGMEAEGGARKNTFGNGTGAKTKGKTVADVLAEAIDKAAKSGGSVTIGKIGNGVSDEAIEENSNLKMIQHADSVYNAKNVVTKDKGRTMGVLIMLVVLVVSMIVFYVKRK